MKKRMRTLFLIVTMSIALSAVAMGGHCRSDQPFKPEKVILDSDMLTDFDDVGALACLHALADAGECEILATLSCTRGNASVAAIEVINGYYGRPNIPVGCAKGMGVSGGSPDELKNVPLAEGGHGKYVKLAKDYPQWVRHANSDDAPDANEVYRRVLAAQPDNSVVICSIGFLTNLRRLLETKPDAVSPLDGRALVAKKVKKWVAMACNYPKGREYNSQWDAESSRIVLETWPTPVVFSDFQYGFDTYAGRAIAEMPGPRNPVKDIFKDNIPIAAIDRDPAAWRGRCFGKAGRSAWDETAVLAAVRGETSYFATERGTYRMVGTSGDDEWTPGANGRHLRLVEKLPKAEVGKIIDGLICTKRAPYTVACGCATLPIRAADALVADPYRAVDVQWKKHVVKGKDFWLLFSPESALDCPGVSETEMVRESGTQWAYANTSPQCQRNYRTITLRTVKGCDAKGKDIPVDFTVTCDDPTAVIWTADNGATAVSAPIGDTRVRYLPVVAKLEVKSAKPLAKVVLTHGTPVGGEIDEVRAFSVPTEYALGKGDCILTFEKPTDAFSCEIACAPYRASIDGIVREKELAERLRNAPFSVHNRMSIWGMLNLPEGAVDKSGLVKIAERYPETFLGVEHTEWDANFLQKLAHGPTSEFLTDLRVNMKVPCTRDEMVKNLYQQWDNYNRMNGGKTFGMSGGINYMHYGVDAGGVIACYEFSDMVGAPKRLSNRDNFSAARQFGTPSSVYMAYFAHACHADSCPRSAHDPNCGEDFGTAPSYGLRNFYLCYYMGINYLSFESQPWAQMKLKEDGKTFMLTKNGEAMLDIFNWSKKPEGARGDWYAPILILKDRRCADDGKYAKSFQPYAFYNLFPATEGDVYAGMIDRTISPGSKHSAFDDPAGGTDLVNSELADIFCHYMADPLKHGEVTLEQIEKYPVTIVAGDFGWTETLANMAKRYVFDGGTLVLTAAQAEPFDADFLGWYAAKSTVASDGLCLNAGTKTPKAEVLVETKDKKLPLVVKSTYGKGNVIYVTAPNFRRNENPKDIAKKNAPPPQLKDLLLALQDEVLPVKFSGSCNAVYNHLPDGTWKILLVNHDGVAKKPNETYEHFFPEYAHDVTLTLPEGAVAKEVRLGAEVKEVEQRKVSLKLPPGGVCVVDVKGVDAASRRVTQDETSSQKFSPVRNFRRRGSSSGLVNDGYRLDPATRLPKEKAPAVIGEWLAKNEFKDSSGNKHDPRTTGKIEFKDGVAVTPGKKANFIAASFDAPYAVKEGTLETWVKPNVDKPGKAVGGVFGLCGGSLMVGTMQGRWSLSMISPFRRIDRYGPAIEPKWTHLLVTFNDEIRHFYVDGVEVKGENGPARLQSSNPEGRGTFLPSITVVYGTDHPNWGSYFSGEMKGIRYTSHYTPPEEAKALAAKKWE